MRDYGVDGQIGLEPTLEEYHARMLDVTAECMRVLKPTGVMFWNHGDSYFGDSPVRKSAAEQFDPDEQYVTKRSEGGLRRSAKREGGLRPKCITMQNERLIIKMIDQQGWILRNRIIWNKPNGMPSSVTDRFSNKYEPVYMLVKSNDTNYYYNTKTGHMQRDKPPGTKGEEGVDWDWKEVGADYSESDTKIGAEDAEKLGSPRARVYREKKIKKVSYWVGRDYWFDLDAVRVPFKDASEVQYRKKLRANKEYDVKAPYKTNTPYKHNAARITSQESPNRMWDDAESLERQIAAGKNPGDVWTIPTQPYPESHFATFPTALIEPMIKAACPAEICPVCGMARERITEKEVEFTSGSGKSGNVPKGKHEGSVQAESGTYDIRMGPKVTHHTTGWTSCDCNAGWIAGTILDPFAGSGTIGEVARKLNRNAILLELNPEYERLISKRIMKDTPPLTAYFGDD